VGGADQCVEFVSDEQLRRLLLARRFLGANSNSQMDLIQPTLAFGISLMGPRSRAVCSCSHMPSRPRLSGSFVDQRRTSLPTTKGHFSHMIALPPPVPHRLAPFLPGPKPRE